MLVFVARSQHPAHEPPHLVTYLAVSDDLEWVSASALAHQLPTWFESLGLRRGAFVRAPLATAILATLLEPLAPAPAYGRSGR